jgi:hypothetical protein
VTAEQIAAAHQRLRKALARRAADEIARLWARIDRTDIARSWAAAVPAALTILGSAQAIAAASAETYLGDLSDAYEVPDDSAGRVRTDAFAGVASDGRDLASLLYEPAIASLVALKRGATVPRALASGRFRLDMISRTQVADAGRTADQVALVAHTRMSGYVRVLSPPSCSRCVILAGRFYRWNAGFNRHPRCDCTGQPVVSAAAANDKLTRPRTYFDSLDPAEQDRAFTKAGAQAIRDGADIAKVVNARRGMYTADGKIYTREAAGRRPRIMPEQLYRDARDRADAIRLLRLHGFIL